MILCVCCTCRLDAVSRSAPTEILFTAPPLTASRSLGTNKYIDGTRPSLLLNQSQDRNKKEACNWSQTLAKYGLLDHVRGYTAKPAREAP